jgi:cephalosporin hydroxylase
MLETDSLNYEVLVNAVLKADKSVPGLYCEIGTRRGGSLKYVIDALVGANNLRRTVVSIDPYGNIPYNGPEGAITRCDYTNSMRDDCYSELWAYMVKLNRMIAPAYINTVFLNLEDTEFFKRFSDGVPIYVNDQKQIVNEYAYVFLDGPHWLSDIITEAEFFIPRMSPGATMVVDDIKLHDHGKLAEYLVANGLKLLETSERKASYIKV